MNELVFALKGEKLISIDDVEKGFKCGCICPCCGEKLVAKKGNIKIHHFAHISGSNCTYGYETSLHKFAKNLLEDLKYIVLPSVEIGKGEDKVLLYESCKVKVQKVELEKRYNDIRPDVIITVNGKILALEIYVTHKVNFEKMKKAKSDNLSIIEINLKELLKNNKNNNPAIIKECLSNIILSESDSRKYWVFNNKKEKYIQERNLGKEFFYYLGKPFTNNCPKINRYVYDYEKSLYRDIHCWVNIQEECKKCEHFLEINEISLICNDEIYKKEDNLENLIPTEIIYDELNNEPMIESCPGYLANRKQRHSIKDCFDCMCFIAADKENIYCALNQKETIKKD